MLDTPRPLFAYVRLFPIESIGYLRHQELHGNRTAPTATTRPGAVRGRQIFWSKRGGEANQYIQDFEAHLQMEVAKCRGGAAIGIHGLIGISREWIEESGGIHDGCNTRILSLFEQARIFVEQAVGGVYAMRLDLDELGGGVVDFFAAPTHMRQSRLRIDGTRGDPVKEVSIRTALKAVQLQTDHRQSYSAIQTLWAAHAAQTLDPRIVRGVPKSVTGREHLSVAEYREAITKAQVDHQQRDGQLATYLATAVRLEEMLAKTETEKRAIERQQVTVIERDKKTDKRSRQVLKDLRAVQAERAELLPLAKEAHHVAVLSVGKLLYETDKMEKAEISRQKEHLVSLAFLNERRHAVDAELGHYLTMSAEAESLQRDLVLKTMDSARLLKELASKASMLDAREAALDRRLADADREGGRLVAQQATLDRLDLERAGQLQDAVRRHDLAELESREKAASAAAAKDKWDKLARELRVQQTEAEEQSALLQRREMDLGRRLIAVEELEKRDAALIAGCEAIASGAIATSDDIGSNCRYAPAKSTLNSIFSSMQARLGTIKSREEALSQRSNRLTVEDHELTLRQEVLAKREGRQEEDRAGIMRLLPIVKSIAAHRRKVGLDAYPEPVRGLLNQVADFADLTRLFRLDEEFNASGTAGARLSRPRVIGKGGKQTK